MSGRNDAPHSVRGGFMFRGRTIAHRPLAIIVLAALASACATTPRADPETEEQTIRALTAQLIQAVKARDIATIMAMYAPDAHVLSPNMAAARGASEIRPIWDEMLAMRNLDFSLNITDLRVSDAGDMAYEVGTYRLGFDGPDGRVTDDGKYTTVWRKVNGQWKVASDIFNTSRPMPAPAPATVLIVEAEQPMLHASGGMQWNDLSVPGFPPGMKIAALHGDPAGKSDYTIRLRFPDGYQFPAHYHPNAEHLSVLQGTFLFAMGERADRSAQKTYGPGDFIYIPPKHPHHGGARGETVIQLHGIGPFEIKLVNPVP